MATRKSQRVGIWIISIAMVIGTIGGFIAMIVAPSNEAKDQAELEAAQSEWTKRNEDVEARRAAQASGLSERYFDIFSQYSNRVTAFSAEGIDELIIDDLLVGSGDEVGENTKFAAYYIGWNPSGEIFDESIDGNSLKAPFVVDGPAGASVIEGWQKGLIGMRIGGVRELTIPSAMAYGEEGGGELIPANTPLKFVIMAVDAPEEIADAEAPQIIKDFYKRQYGIDL